MSRRSPSPDDRHVKRQRVEEPEVIDLVSDEEMESDVDSQTTDVYEWDESDYLTIESEPEVPVKSEPQEPPKPVVEWRLIEKFDRHYDSRMKRLELKARFEVTHNLDQFTSLEDFTEEIDSAFESAVEPIIAAFNDIDRVSFNVTAEGLTRPIYLRPVPVNKFDKKSFLNKIMSVCQSNREFLGSRELVVRVHRWKALRGSANNTRMKTYTEESDRKQSVVVVRNSDNSCGYRAITLGYLYHTLNVRGNARLREWMNARKYPATLFRETLSLIQRLGLSEDIVDNPLDEDTLRLLDQTLNDYQIIVIDKTSGDQMFVGTDRPKVIYLESGDDHYNMITSMPGYRRMDAYCKYCNVGFRNNRGHVCENGCGRCQSPTECESDGDVYVCSDCNVEFDSLTCFERHQLYVCKFKKQCRNCEMVITTRRAHKCGQYHCIVCNEDYEVQPHFCYIAPLKTEKIVKEDKRNNVMVAYDIECQLIRQPTGEHLHQPVLLVMNMYCDKCSDTGCVICGDKWFVFWGDECVDHFVDKIKELSAVCEREKSSMTVFAHNNTRYDGQFVFRSMLKKGIKGLDPTQRGLGLMKIQIGNVRFIDSYLILMSPLSKLVGLFGIDGEVKGFFPYYFRRRDYALKYRDIPKSEFGYGQMSIERATEFDQWYTEHLDQDFNYDFECEKYCRSDVRILMESLKRFRELFKSSKGIDPITRMFTIAGIGYEYFRAKIMEPKKFNICPINGFYHECQSASGNAWLDLIEETSLRAWKKPIIREYAIGKYKVDGFIDVSGLPPDPRYGAGVVLEYKGCHWHRHQSSSCPINDIVDEDIVRRDQKREDLFRKMGFTVFTQWECEWEQDLTEDDELKEKFRQRLKYHSKVKRNKLWVKARDAYHGGLIESFKFSWRATGDESIRYLDFNSLYPSAMMAFDVPIGAPTIWRGNWDEIVPKMFGLVSCAVLPPSEDMFPVLPLMINGKLMFPLCFTCAKKQKRGQCRCPDEKRVLKGCWTTAEIVSAVKDYGYKIWEWYEIVHYEEGDNKMLGQYIRENYNMKQEASGWPRNCVTDEDRELFLAEYKAKMGSDLDPAKIERNPGKRTLSKLLMNGLYGKFAQSPNMPQTLVTKNRSQVWDLIRDPDIDVLSEDRIEDMYIFTYKYIDDTMATPGNTSVIVAAFICAYARLLLIHELKTIHESGQQVLYADTDSVVFVHTPGKYLPEIGEYLGQMADEVEGEYGLGAKIVEFYTTGAKSYCFKVQKADGTEAVKIKSKGLTLNVDALESINFDVIAEKARAKARGEETDPTLVRQTQFRIDREHVVTTRSLEKRFNVTSNKRMAYGNDTFPYGWKGRLPDV